MQDYRLEKGFLRGRLHDFYKSNFIKQPPGIAFREFGRGDFGKKITQRHLAFKDAKAFNDFLQREVPFYVSYSGAYYKFPARTPMQAKEMIKADLFYEFDADDLTLPCQQGHDLWLCRCGAKGKGKLESCPECGAKVSVKEWVCPECLEVVKGQLQRLLGFLENDLNLLDDFSINFSGHKGYHLHIRSEAVQNFSAEARIQIVDFLSAKDLDLAQLGFFKHGKKWLCPKEFETAGWSRKMLHALKEFFADASAEELSKAASRNKFNLSLSKAEKMLEKREEMAASIDSGLLFQLERKTDAFWQNILEHLVDKIKLDLDRQTSIDLVKILRVPETIHGGTGLKASVVERDALKGFNPLQDCVVFPEKEREVFVLQAPKFFLGGKWFGPFEQEKVELPEFAAVYLLSKGDALLKEVE